MIERVPWGEYPGALIRSLLRERGMTQADLAAAAGCSRQYVNDLVCGRRGVSIPMAVALASGLGGTPEDWLRLDARHELARLGQTEQGAAAP